MPARGHVGDVKDRGRKAAELYIQAELEQDRMTAADVAARFGVSISTVRSFIKRVRKERREQAGSKSP